MLCKDTHITSHKTNLTLSDCGLERLKKKKTGETNFLMQRRVDFLAVYESDPACLWKSSPAYVISP